MHTLTKASDMCLSSLRLAQDGTNRSAVSTGVSFGNKIKIMGTLKGDLTFPQYCLVPTPCPYIFWALILRTQALDTGYAVKIIWFLWFSFQSQRLHKHNK